MSQRRTRGPAADTRERLLTGTLTCLRELGRERTTVAAVSRASGLSRPTIYAHFDTLEDLVHEAVEQASYALSMRLGSELAAVDNAGDRMVEFVVAAHREFKSDPVVALLMDTTAAPGLTTHGEIPTSTFQLSRKAVSAALRDEPAALDRIDDIIETVLRFLLSVLAYGSENTRTDDRLRAYLRRTLLPALDLSSSAHAPA